MKLLVAILLLAASLRSYQLTSTPAGLYWDEADTGYQAYSLLRTGRDYFGNGLPIHLQSFADYRSGLYIYLTVPFIKFFGLTPLTVRAPAVVISLLSIAASYLFAARVLKLGRYSWLLPLVFTFSPWTLVQGRVAAESQLLLPLFFLGTATYFSKHYSLSALFYALTLYSYPTAKLFLPLFLLVLFTLKAKRVNFRYLLVPGIIFLAVSWLPIYETFAKPIGRRFAELSIFNDPTVSTQIQTSRQEAYLGAGAIFGPGLNPGPAQKLVYNKFSFWGTKLLANYSSAFSSGFLFTAGDPNLRHHLNAPNTGQFYLVEIVPFLIGLFLIFTRLRTANYRLLAIWLLLSPLPAVFTTDGGTHAPRLLFLFPAVASVITLGLKKIITATNNLRYVYFLLYLISLSLSTFYLFTTYRVKSATAFNAGFNQAARLALTNRDRYDQVVLDAFNESLLMAYLFESAYPPRQFQTSFPLPAKTIATGVEGYKFDRIVILYPGTRNWSQITLPGSSLIITRATQPYATSLKPAEQILYPDATPAFIVTAKSD